HFRDRAKVKVTVHTNRTLPKKFPDRRYVGMTLVIITATNVDEGRFALRALQRVCCLRKDEVTRIGFCLMCVRRFRVRQRKVRLYLRFWNRTMLSLIQSLTGTCGIALDAS